MMGKVPGLTKRAKFAPFESCIGCYRGDTRTAVFVRGEAEFAVAVLMKAAGMTQDEATRTFEVGEHDVHGTELGEVRGGVNDRAFRLCEDCAEKAGITVSAADSDEPFVYLQP